MDRPYLNKNGFTFMEMLIVLLIVSLLNFGLYTKMNTSLYVFMKQVQILCITAQEKAYVENRKVSIDINEKMVIDEKNYFMPKDVACDSVSFYYNAKGNISKAFTLYCQNSHTKMKLVFQLGSGRIRLEKV